MKPTIEYRVRPVTRYIVTRFETSMELDEAGRASGHATSSVVGEFENEPSAAFVAEALAIVQDTDGVATVQRHRLIAEKLVAASPSGLTGPQTPA